MKAPPRTPQATTLIDGYNLMFQSVRFPDPRDGAQALQKARDYFLNYLGDRLNHRARLRTWIVFDSQSDLLLPQEIFVRDMRILFSVGYNSADDLLHELIDQHSAPRNLIVVSSDHQVQKKANARGAFSVDSEDWVDSWLSLFPIQSEEAPSALNAAIHRQKSPRSNPRLKAQERAKALERIKKDQIDLNLPDDFLDQMDQIMGSVVEEDWRTKRQVDPE